MLASRSSLLTLILASLFVCTLFLISPFRLLPSAKAARESVAVSPLPVETSVMTDDFNDNRLDGTKWRYNNSSSPSFVYEQNQRLEIPLQPNATGYYGIQTMGTRDLREKTVSVELVQPTSQGGWVETYYQLKRDEANYYHMSVGAGSFVCDAWTNGVRDRTVLPYDASVGRFWRFRHDVASNTMNFETSADGNTWTTHKIVAVGFPLDSMYAVMLAGAWGTGNGAPGAAIFDNFNIKSTSANQPPSVTLTKPAYNATFGRGSTITLAANAADADGGIQRVEFFEGPNKLGEDTTAPYSISWGNVKPGNYFITAKAVDVNGAMTTSNASYIAVSNSPTVEALLVIADPANMPASDAVIKARLENLGFTVTVKDAVSAVASDATNKSLVFVSETVVSANLTSKFRDVAVPVISAEPQIFDDMQMTGPTLETDYGYAGGQTQALIQVPSHPLAAGCTGTVNISTMASGAAWGRPAASAAQVASMTYDGSKKAIFAYESGAMMVGMAAPARRVGLIHGNDAFNSLTETGGALFDAAVRWATTTPSFIEYPYNNTPATIPGTVQVELFDEGGEGTAYHDLTPGNDASNTYRYPTDVDAFDGGIGYVQAGEWLKYTVNVTAAGTYRADVSLAAGTSGGTFHIEFDGVDVTGPMSVPNTGGWGNYQTVSKSGISLSAGQHIMRIVMDSNGSNGYVANFDSVKFLVPTSTTDLVAYWKLDEGSGTVANDSAGSNTGTLSGPTRVTGRVGAGALSFDGVDDRVIVSGTSALTSLANNFTVSFWAYPRSTHEIDAEGYVWGGTSGQKYALGPRQSGPDAGAGVSIGTNGVSVYEHGDNYMPASLVYQGQLSGWTHITLVYENKQPRLYINGALVRTGITSQRANVFMYPQEIGGMVYGYYDGQLDDIRVYSRALNSTEVSSLAITGAGSNPATEFAAGQNPNGVWSYGWRPAAGGAFKLYPNHDQPSGNGGTWWDASIVMDQWNLPIVSHGAGSPLIQLHPGPRGEQTIVRWTAPTATTVNVSGRFENMNNATTDVHVVYNSSTALFDGAINGQGSVAPFSIRKTVAAGDTLDFVVGWGSNGNYNYDSTGLSLSLAPDSGSPYDDTKTTVTGTIEAENFNNGGEGIAYHDTTPGTHGQDYDQPPSYPPPSFRQPTDVDIYKSVNYSGGYLVLMQAGDWMRYAIDVSATGTYGLTLRTAWGDVPGGTFHIEMDGADRTGPIQIPNSAWALTTITGPNLDLTAGRHVMRVVADTNATNGSMGDIDFIRLTLIRPNDAAFVSQSIPTQMIAGQSYSGSITMRNIGSNTWSSAGNYNLGSQNPQDNFTWGAARFGLPSAVAPNSNVTFNFTIKAPSTAGTYNLQARMVQDTVEWFGALTPNVVVNVAPRPNDAAFVSQSIPTQMVAGQSYSVSVTMKNTGSNTWTTAGNYNLGSQNPPDNLTWGGARVALQASQTVAPGAQVTFPFAVRAPATAGTYNFQWQMEQDNVEWFGALAPSVPVTVSSAKPQPTPLPASGPTPTPAPTPLNLQLYYEGKLRDRVSQSESVTGDGALDATFNVALPFFNNSGSIADITLDRGDGPVWDTIPNNGLWTLGVAPSYDAPMVVSSGGIGFSPASGSSFKIFASDAANFFAAGKTFKLTVRFRDGTVGTGAVTLTQNDSDFTSAQVDPRNRTGSPGMDLLSGNYNWSGPVVKLPGRAGLDLSLSLAYNSLVWIKDTSSTRIQYDVDQGFPSPGFRLGFPVIQPQYFNPQANKYAYLMIMPSGERIELRQVSANTYESADSSYLQMTVGASGLTVNATDGTQLSFTLLAGEYRCTEIRDRNGNFISINNDSRGRISTITDTVGRMLTFNYDAVNGVLTSITQPWNVNGQALTHKWAEFSYTTVNLQTNFGGLAMVGALNNQNIRVLQQIKYADGSGCMFFYTSWGMVYGIAYFAPDGSQVRTTRFILPTVDASGFTSLNNDCPRSTQKRDSARNWNGASNAPGAPSEAVTSYKFAALEGTGIGQVTTPDGGVIKEFFATTGWQNGLTQKVETWSPPTFTNGVGWTNGVLKKTVITDWTQDNEAIGFQLNPRPKDMTIIDGEGNRRRRTHYDYSDPSDPNVLAFGLVAGISEYGTDDTTPLRSTKIKYNLSQMYLTSRVIGLISERDLYNGQGALFAKMTYDYDEDGFLVAPSAAPIQHYNVDFGPGYRLGRGNLSRVRRWDVTDSGNVNKSLASEVGHDTAGSPVFTRVFSLDEQGRPVTRQVNISYADALSALAYPTTITDQENYTTTTAYNYDMGVVVSAKDPKGAVRTIIYDEVTGRVKRSELNNGVFPNNSYTRFEYPANGVALEQYSKVDTNKPEFYAAQVMDGDGRVRATISSFPGSAGGYRAQRFTYDVMGQLVEQSNPAEISVDPTQKLEVLYWRPGGDDASGWQWSKQAYDWKGRPIVTTNADATTSTVSYEGCGCAGGEQMTVTDESGRKRKSYHDALGRTVRTEIYEANGSTVYSTTLNTYNTLDQLASIRVFKGAAPATDDGSCPEASCQLTTLEYDAYGRLWKNKPAVQTAPTIYNYNPDDTLRTVADPRGVTVTYSYYPRGLLKGVAYTLPSTPPIDNTGQPINIPATPNVGFGYDEVGNRLWMTDGLGRVDYTYDTFSKLSSENRFFSGLGRSYMLSYTYDLAGAVKTITEPFGRVITYNYDEAGTLKGVTGAGTARTGTYASNLQYRAWGALKHMDYGNGVTVDLGYNSRLQMSSYDLNRPPTQGFETGLMNSTFKYYPDGRLKSADEQQDDFDRAFDYDQLGRVSEAYTGQEARDFLNGVPSQGPQNGPYRQSYRYDPWGNLSHRTSRYWSTGSPDFDANYQASTNRNPLWRYDAMGNVAKDDVFFHEYNGAVQPARMTEVANGPIVELYYDGDGLVTRSVERDRFVQTRLYRDDYSLHSSALGGETILEVDPLGRLIKRFVYADGEVVAREQGSDYPMGYPINDFLFFEHREPVTGRRRGTRQGTFPAHESNIEPDVTGINVGLFDPATLQTQDPVDPGAPTLDPEMPSACTVNGIQFDCAYAALLLSSNSAVECPQNDCSPRWNPDRDGYGHGGWQIFSPTLSGDDWYNIGPLDFSNDPRPTLQRKQYEEIASLGSLPGPRPRRPSRPGQGKPDGRRSTGQPGTRSRRPLTQWEQILEWRRSKAYWDRYYAETDRKIEAVKQAQMTKNPEPGMTPEEEQEGFDNCARAAFREFRWHYAAQGGEAVIGGAFVIGGTYILVEGLPTELASGIGFKAAAEAIKEGSDLWHILDTLEAGGIVASSPIGIGVTLIGDAIGRGNQSEKTLNSRLEGCRKKFPGANHNRAFLNF